MHHHHYHCIYLCFLKKSRWKTKLTVLRCCKMILRNCTKRRRRRVRKEKRNKKKSSKPTGTKMDCSEKLLSNRWWIRGNRRNENGRVIAAAAERQKKKNRSRRQDCRLHRAHRHGRWSLPASLLADSDRLLLFLLLRLPTTTTAHTDLATCAFLSPRAKRVRVT